MSLKSAEGEVLDKRFDHLGLTCRQPPVPQRDPLTNGVAWSEAGILVVHVKDVQRRPIVGVQIGVEGDGGSAITGDDGKARISLAKETTEKTWASLQILKSPPGKSRPLQHAVTHAWPTFPNKHSPNLACQTSLT